MGNPKQTPKTAKKATEKEIAEFETCNIPSQEYISHLESTQDVVNKCQNSLSS
jgi:hypothetical protein